MSWDVSFGRDGQALGDKQTVREQLLAACESYLGRPVERRGPTEQLIDDSFSYEVLFIGPAEQIDEVCLTIKFVDQEQEGPPSPDHPVWAFLRAIVAHADWRAFDSFNGQPLTWR
ncbi:MAG: hypothetical protein H6707_00660 [Deltaproteobacteria bacterium]|nr:hypothetical protein [Deltaproteobacteria bacterium]